MTLRHTIPRPITYCPEPAGMASLRRLGLIAATVAIAGCGGGDNDDSAGPAPAPVPVATTMKGVAASGAPFFGAKLTAVDATGATVCDTTVSTTGTYVCELPATTRAPLVISALRDDVGLYSVTAGTTGGTVNVTPITTIVASRLSPNGDPAQLATAIQANPTTVDDTKIQSQVSQVEALLKSLLDSLGDATNPITGSFTADGTGHDRVLDAIAVTVRPDGTAANIEVTVKTIPASAEALPVAVSFRSSDPTPPALPAVTAVALPPPGTSTAVADLLKRITACYALPLSQRVNAASDTTAVVGTAADVKSPVCKSAFFNDDPGTYLYGGNRVGRSAANTGSFSGLFRPGATGAVFDRGEIGYYLPNGDVFVVFRTVDAAGNVAVSYSVARNSGGSLKFIGDQYAYFGMVFPSVQERDFINAPSLTYYNVGYDLSVDNVLSNGVTIFSKVVVTAPGGATYTLVPTVGSNSLRLLRANGTVTGTTILRLNAAYRNLATAGNPAERDTSLVYVSPRLTDSQISELPNQGVWKMEFFHADPARPNVIQTTRTLQRSYQLAEAAQVKFVTLTSPMRARLVELTAQTRNFIYTSPPSATSPNAFYFGNAATNAWAVPSLAVTPSAFTVFGNAPTVNGVIGAPFDDRADISSSARTATVNCSLATNTDAHCDTSTGVTQYAQNSTINYVQLSGRNARLVTHLAGSAFYVP
jgi:hypothetical protein